MDEAESDRREGPDADPPGPESDRREGPDADPPGPESGQSGGSREVVVPMRLYKTVTVFSTLVAVVAVVVGFTLLDAATLEMSLLRGVVVRALDAVGARPSPDVLGAALAVCGLATIGFGAGVYTLGTRFRARGMGNAQEDGNEGSTDG